MQVLQDFCLSNQIPFITGADMKQLTTFRTGGTAAFLAEVESKAQLSALVAFLTQQKMGYFVLGNGSNLLAPDGEITLPLIRLRGEFQQMMLLPNHKILCGAGATLTQLCRFAQQNSLTGLEFAFGIPGTVGGAAFMNAGAYGGEMAQVITRCHHLEADGSEGSYEPAQLNFGYRQSAYQTGACIITAAELQLAPGNQTEILQKMEELMQRRRDKQPLEKPSAGSTFRRPVGQFAGGLIDQCGLKGLAVGGAMVSPKHAGFLVNHNNATTQDVLDLIQKVQQIVAEQTGYHLECEVRQIPQSQREQG